MAVTNLDPINTALLLIGESTLSSLSGSDEKTEIVANTYLDLQKAEMARYPWRFTMKKVQLSQNVTAPVTEWKYAYDMPADSMNGGVEELRETADTSAPVERKFEVYGDQLFTDLATAWLDYQVHKAESLWPRHFEQAMVHVYAAYWADAMTDDEEKARLWWNRAYGDPQLGGGGGYVASMRNVDARISGDYGRRMEDHSLIAVRG